MSASIRQIRGVAKLVFNLRLCIDRFFFFGRDLLQGRMDLRQFVATLRRLLGFLVRMQHNKFTEIEGRIRLGLYIPGYPSRAFDQASRKFATFGVKSPNTTVLISLTSACAFRCEHCYQHLDKGADSALDPILQAARELQDLGTAFVNIEGGDTFLAYERLRRLCATLDDRSEIWVNSAGKGITLERLAELKTLGLTAVMFSMHSHEPERMNSFMGRSDAWSSMSTGIDLCHQAGVPVALNCCLTVDQFSDGTFEAVMERAKSFGACLVQLIKPKPAGNWLHSHHSAFPPEVLSGIAEKVATYNSHPGYRNFPSISAQIVEESPQVFGCTAGGTDRFYINAKGDVQPCEFLNLSFGNLNEESFGAIFERMRKTFDRPGQTWLCEKHASDVASIMQERNLDRLPLPLDQSRRIHENWNLGPETPLYREIEDR
ncbi:MAG: radical SAM protein [Fibrobacteria bacterium]|nr:radical SAM protein [Fibrobacteria bacterium]